MLLKWQPTLLDGLGFSLWLHALLYTVYLDREWHIDIEAISLLVTKLKYTCKFGITWVHRNILDNFQDLNLWLHIQTKVHFDHRSNMDPYFRNFSGTVDNICKWDMKKVQFHFLSMVKVVGMYFGLDVQT